MGTVIIREHNTLARVRAGGSGDASGLLEGVLVTDEEGLSIKTVTTVLGTPVDSARLTPKTHFVALESDKDCRYAVRPRGRNSSLAATANHHKLPANAVVVEAVYPGAIISFLQMVA